MSREKVEATPRKRLTKAQKTELLARQDDCCGLCGESLIWAMVDGAKVYGPMIDEHILPLFVAGGNQLANRAYVCLPCAKAKTKREATENAKIRRLLIKNDPETRPQSKMQSRGFSRHPTLKRTMSGKVVPRT